VNFGRDGGKLKGAQLVRGGEILLPWYSSKSGLIHKHIVKHIGESEEGETMGFE
jgi:hypothetical protein